MRVVQEAAIAALRAHAPLADAVTGIFDGPPERARYPYVSMAESVSTDWGTKTARGREVSVAVTLWDDGRRPARMQDLMDAVEDAIEGMARDLGGWRVVTLLFRRSRVVRDADGPWAGLVEYRVRILEN